MGAPNIQVTISPLSPSAERAAAAWPAPNGGDTAFTSPHLGPPQISKALLDKLSGKQLRRAEPEAQQQK
jgi:hypothetical protein